MTINLSEERGQAVRSLMEGGRYASEDEVIDDALRLLQERDERSGRIEALRGSVEDMRAGRLSPAEDMLAEMRQILVEVPGR